MPEAADVTRSTPRRPGWAGTSSMPDVFVKKDGALLSAAGNATKGD